MPAGHAGSSPKGYDGLTLYGPTSHAAQVLKGVERDYGLREVTAWPIAPLHMHCAVLELSANADRASVLASLTQDRRVRIAQPLQTFATQTAIYDDPYVGLQRGFQQMEVPEAHAWSRGEGVRIAIIDTGVDTQHPDLRGAVVQIGNFVDSDAEQFRRDRHGTELAGIIAAVANNHEGIVGVAPGARLAVFKACWQLHDDADAARCNSFTLAQALTAALDAHVHIVNLSLERAGGSVAARPHPRGAAARNPLHRRSARAALGGRRSFPGGRRGDRSGQRRHRHGLRQLVARAVARAGTGDSHAAAGRPLRFCLRHLTVDRTRHRHRCLAARTQR